MYLKFSKLSPQQHHAVGQAQAGILTCLSWWPTDSSANLATCLRCQGTTDGAHVTRTNISELPDTPIWSEKQAILCKGEKKRQRKTKRVGWEPSGLCENTWQASLGLHLANTPARIQAGVSYTDPTVLNTDGKSEESTDMKFLKLCGRK